MTWGKQNTEAEAHEQLGYALDQGINFLDTAEVPCTLPEQSTSAACHQLSAMQVQSPCQQLEGAETPADLSGPAGCRRPGED